MSAVAARVRAPAKLTLSLAVVGVRPDGYHELRSEMVTVDLCDVVELAEGDGLVVVDEGVRPSGLGAVAAAAGRVVPGTVAPPTPGRPNLVERALRAVGRTAAVTLRKRIPVGGGLGGGSADAAAVLRWAGCTDPGVAAGLGADVPFCVVGGRAMVEGIGERVSPLPFEERTFTLCVPPLAVDTAAAYRAWDRIGGEGLNELTAAALAVEPRLAAWRDAFAAVAGAEPVLAGSGSTWWVEGGCPAGHVEVGGEVAPLLGVRTVPAGWG